MDVCSTPESGRWLSKAGVRFVPKADIVGTAITGGFSRQESAGKYEIC